MDTLVPGLIGTAVGAVIGFVGAAWIDRRRFERDRELRQAEELEGAARELVDTTGRVMAEAGTYDTLIRHGKGDSLFDVLEPYTRILRPYR